MSLPDYAMLRRKIMQKRLILPHFCMFREGKSAIMRDN